MRIRLQNLQIQRTIGCPYTLALTDYILPIFININIYKYKYIYKQNCEQLTLKLLLTVAYLCSYIAILYRN